MRLVLALALSVALAAPALAQRASSRIAAVVVTFEGSVPADPTDPVPELLTTITQTNGFLSLEAAEQPSAGAGRRAAVPRLKIRASIAFESLEAYKSWIGDNEGQELVGELKSETPPGDFLTTIRVITEGAAQYGPQ